MNKEKKMFFKREKEMIPVIHYSAKFKTIDGEEHVFNHFRYADPSSIRCTIPEFIMIGVKSDGYLADNNGTMYPLNNIISISWTQDDTAEVEKEPYCTFYKI